MRGIQQVLLQTENDWVKKEMDRNYMLWVEKKEPIQTVVDGTDQWPLEVIKQYNLISQSLYITICSFFR